VPSFDSTESFAPDFPCKRIFFVSSHEIP
jgi:hypothetical protein